jgi:hypothetical protein
MCVKAKANECAKSELWFHIRLEPRHLRRFPWEPGRGNAVVTIDSCLTRLQGMARPYAPICYLGAVYVVFMKAWLQQNRVHGADAVRLL